MDVDRQEPPHSFGPPPVLYAVSRIPATGHLCRLLVCVPEAISISILIKSRAFARSLFIPPSRYGIGSPNAVKSLVSALDDAPGGRNRFALVNNGFSGGDIDTVIRDVQAQTDGWNGEVLLLDQEQDLLTECRNTIRGTSNCFAGVAFFSSPDEGPYGKWNYSLRADGGLQSGITVDSDNNDIQRILLPVQHAVDSAISRLNGGTPLPEQIEEYPYTSKTQKERDEEIRIRYMSGIINVLAVAFFIGIVLVTYQLTGLVATEREIGMAQLLDSMMPNTRRWQPQMARIIANHFAFDLIYAPGWIVMAIILSGGVFAKTSAGIVVINNILGGLAVSSFSILGASLFRKAQLSGISLVICLMLLAVVAQVVGKGSTGAVAILSLLFTPFTYVNFIIVMARFERKNQGTNLLTAAPENPSTLPGLALWIFFILQIVIFPLIGAWIERFFYGTASKERVVSVSNSSTAVALNGFTKRYSPTVATRIWAKITGKPADYVVAVNDLTLEARRGEILVLLGANGSGKSTTLDSIAGLNSISSGSINVNYAEHGAGLGLCPQKNVLWDELTVREHIRLFNKLKSRTISSKAENEALLADCDILSKLKAKAKTLSGGQKRKLQLAMMFTGGSSICAVDEVSSGIDPLSRRKIWDILLTERGRRTIILTTHFLDEADLLADHIAILSKGHLKASGTSVALKHQLGSGYRVHVYKTQGTTEQPAYQDFPHTIHDEQTTYLLPSSAETAQFLTRLETDGITEYQVSGPTIEDVFLKVADEVNTSEEDSFMESAKENGETVPSKTAGVAVRQTKTRTPELLPGRRIGVGKQLWILLQKRFTILRRNPLPYLAALLIPIIAAGLVTLFLQDYARPGCDPVQTAAQFDPSSLSTEIKYNITLGPTLALTPARVEVYVNSFVKSDTNTTNNSTQLQDSTILVNSFQQFQETIDTLYANVTPGGIWLGDDSSGPTFAWRGNGGVFYATIVQNALSNLLSNKTISMQYQPFDIPWASDVGDALQLITYFGLAMAVYPAFFALYPTVERLRNVRGLHFSNGVRSAPLWAAYTLFDFSIVLMSSALAAIIFSAVSSAWFHIGYLFLIFFLYGLASTLLSYCISLISTSQLAAFAWVAGGQCVMFLLYFIAFMSVLTYSPTSSIDSLLNVTHFTIAAISPVANLTRAMFIGLNIFSVTCTDRQLQSPGAMTAYGGPILYLILQSILLFGVLLLWDSGSPLRRFRNKQKTAEIEEKDTLEPEVSHELQRVTSSRDGLRVLNITKRFKKNLAVNNVTFGVPKSEVFALLGPNGAGKSTLISLIRGDIRPSQRGGDILVHDISVLRTRAAARAQLGVCPQFDAMDRMTVTEHLQFYAKIRGVEQPAHNVAAVMQAVGLEAYADRMAEKLSGGNKRKLSLGIALMGNPAVLLLDEPSSGMDAAAKRVMWRVLASVVPGRSLVLTTHSMEEADALANRAGILSSKMLALGTTDYLRRKHGDAYYVHVVHKNAPHCSEADMLGIRQFVQDRFPTAKIEREVYGGQLRFTLPINHQEDEQSEKHGILATTTTSSSSNDNITTSAEDLNTSNSRILQPSNVAGLFNALETRSEELGVAYYSVSRSTLDQVFLSIVGKHNVEEEGAAKAADVGRKRGRALLCF